MEGENKIVRHALAQLDQAQHEDNLGITFGQKLSKWETLAVRAGLVEDSVAVQD